MKGCTINKWTAADGSVHNNYECDSCLFSTLDPAKMQEHLWREDHRWPFAPGQGHPGRVQPKEVE